MGAGVTSCSPHAAAGRSHVCPVFSTDRVTQNKHETSVMLGWFPRTSLAPKQSHVFKTSILNRIDGTWVLPLRKILFRIDCG